MNTCVVDLPYPDVYNASVAVVPPCNGAASRSTKFRGTHWHTPLTYVTHTTYRSYINIHPIRELHLSSHGPCRRSATVHWLAIARTRRVPKETTTLRTKWFMHIHRIIMVGRTCIRSPKCTHPPPILPHRRWVAGQQPHHTAPATPSKGHRIPSNVTQGPGRLRCTACPPLPYTGVLQTSDLS